MKLGEAPPTDPGSPINIGRCWGRSLVLTATLQAPAKPLRFLNLMIVLMTSQSPLEFTILELPF